MKNFLEEAAPFIVVTSIAMVIFAVLYTASLPKFQIGDSIVCCVNNDKCVDVTVRSIKSNTVYLVSQANGHFIRSDESDCFANIRAEK